MFFYYWCPVMEPVWPRTRFAFSVKTGKIHSGVRIFLLCGQQKKNPELFRCNTAHRQNNLTKVQIQRGADHTFRQLSYQSGLQWRIPNFFRTINLLNKLRNLFSLVLTNKKDEIFKNVFQGWTEKSTHTREQPYIKILGDGKSQD